MVFSSGLFIASDTTENGRESEDPNHFKNKRATG